jgi:nicotinamidase/pyrazinamidase
MGFNTFLIEDACRGVNVRQGDVQAAIEQMRAAGVNVLTSAAIQQEIAAN